MAKDKPNDAHPGVGKLSSSSPVIKSDSEIHICGLVKVRPGRYSVVTGTVANPIVDTTAEPFEYASQSLQVAILRMLQVMP